MPSHKAKTASKSSRRAFLRLLSLVGNEITVYHPEQKLGNTYSARVLMVEDNLLTINLPRRMAGQGYLRESAEVVVNFIIDDTLYEASANYRAEDDKMREIIIGGDIRPTTRRHFARLPLKVGVGYTPVSDFSLSSGRLPHITWNWCQARDISGGGILIQTHHKLPVGAYLLLNLEIESFQGSLFVFGQVRWQGISDLDSKLFQCGIMFISWDELPYHFSPQTISWLPPIMQQFDKEKQDELDKFLMQNSSRSKGDQHDS